MNAPFRFPTWWTTGLAMATALMLAACASKPGRAPVEERSPGGAVSRPAVAAPLPDARPMGPAAASTSQVSGAASASTAGPGRTLPGSPGAGDTAASLAASAPGTYVVKPGDTLIRIGLDHGQNWRDIARWSGIDNPNLIEVGQVLRVSPPGQEPAVAASRPVATPGRLESRPLEARPAEARPLDGAPPAPAAVPGAPAANGEPVAPPTNPGRPVDDTVEWGWPAVGTLLAYFDEARGIKGLSIGGKAGDPVLAAADGRVVYAGSGLRGYGNLVIVKHNSTFLSAYAHNQTLLVKEDQAVRRGQKIAEMGSSDADRVKLHFEIRRQGKPVDPVKWLPAR